MPVPRRSKACGRGRFVVSIWDRRANEIFLEAVELPESDRAEFLGAACHDDSGLRRRVEGLLAAASKSRDFIERPIVRRPRDSGSASSIDVSPFEGKYQLQEKIGSGGMGVVYAAMQTIPIVRKVAVKLVRSDGDDPAQVARFEQERQALALMDHPNIAKVFDAGTTQDGRPYLVMEFIAGASLVEFCDRAALTIDARLELFVGVCRGLHHAHQKGVIHRDLKPSNILVSDLEGRPTPKLIDFGVAKAIGARLIDRTLQTGQSTLVGTLEYMAPEQAGLSDANGRDVDVRSDVYSMGVILYELLAGVRPFERQRLTKASLDEAVRIVRDETPPGMDRRLSEHPTLAAAAANRRTDPKTLLAAVKGDLNWIVFRCLSKDRERRYPSANDLADDVRRYRSNEPIEARPPSSVYRLQKLVQRRRGAAIAASLVLLSLVGGTIGTTIGFLRADRARLAEAAERENAEAARDQAWDALDAMTSAATGDSLAAQPEVSAEQKRFLADAVRSYRQLAQGKADGERARKRTALATRRVAHIEGILGDHLRSAAAYLDAAKAFTSLAESFPADREYRRLAATSYGPAGVAYSRAGRSTEEGEYLRKAVDALRALRTEAPDDPTIRSDYAGVLHNLALHDRNAGRGSEATRHAMEARAIFEALAAEDRSELHFQASAAGCDHLLAILAQARNDLAEAERRYRRALALREAIQAARPNDPHNLGALALCRRNLGRLLCVTGRPVEGERRLSEGLAGVQQLADRFPSQPRYREECAGAMMDLANAYFGRGKIEEQLKLQRSAAELLERLVAEQPQARHLAVSLGGAHCNVANLLRMSGRFEDAIALYDKAVALLDARRKDEHAPAHAADFLEKALTGRGDSKESLSQWLSAAEDHRRLIGLVNRQRVAVVRVQAAFCLMKGGRAEAATAELDSIEKDPPLGAFEWYMKARIEASLSQSTPEKRLPFADRAVSSLERSLRGGLQRPGERLAAEDFRPLRERADFKRLVRQAAAAPPSGVKAPLG
jgi:serine/threonine protein kinase